MAVTLEEFIEKLGELREEAGWRYNFRLGIASKDGETPIDFMLKRSTPNEDGQAREDHEVLGLSQEDLLEFIDATISEPDNPVDYELYEKIIQALRPSPL